MKDNRKSIQILVILTIIFTIMGGSLAYWNWTTTEEQKTNVVFTVGSNFSCAADGGGDISSDDIGLVPTTCTDSEYKEAYPDALPRVINRGLKGFKSKIGAEYGIAALVSLVDICTANNTVAIVTVGPIAKDISDEVGLEPKRVAGIMDMFSCVFQGIIPYGAQLISAAGLAALSPFAIMKYLFYPYLMGISAVIAIAVYHRRKK